MSLLCRHQARTILTGAVPRAPKPEELRFKTKDDGYVHIHPSSVNFQVRYYSSPYLVYHEKIRTSKVHSCFFLRAIKFLLLGFIPLSCVMSKCVSQTFWKSYMYIRKHGKDFVMKATLRLLLQLTNCSRRSDTGSYVCLLFCAGVHSRLDHGVCLLAAPVWRW